MQLASSAYLLRCQHHFLLRTLFQHQMVLGTALHPSVLHEGIGYSDIKWIVPDGDLVTLNRGIAECFRPVVNVIDNDPTPR